MGKTVPSYRMALEWEISGWKKFRAGLASEEQRQAFDELMDMCRCNAMAAGNACKPILFEPMVMSILLAQQVRIQKLERQLKELMQKSGETEHV